MKKVLVLDDDPSTRRLLHLVLAKAKFKILTAATGVEALDCLQKESVHLILTDYVMAGMDGFSFVDRVRDIPGYAAIPVIMLTGHDRPEMIIPSHNRQIAHFFSKPLNPARMVEKISELLEIPLKN